MGRLGVRSRVVLGCALVSFMGAGVLAFAQGSAGAVDPGPLVSAWNSARAEGSYRFAGELTQTLAPVASVETAGKVSQSSSMGLQGVTDLGAVATEMQVSGLKANGVGGGGDTVGVRVVDGVTSQRRGSGEWVESGSSVSGIAPAGDFMAYLGAARDVIAVGSDTVDGRLVTKYGFVLDGASFESSMAKQVAAAHQLNPKAPAVSPQSYAGVSGSGELWVDAGGLPVRQVLLLEYPATAAGSVSTEITINFSEFGTAVVPGVTHRSAGWWQFELPTFDGAWLLALLGMALLLAAALMGVPGSGVGSSRPLVRTVALWLVVMLFGVNLPTRVEAASAAGVKPARGVFAPSAKAVAPQAPQAPKTNPHLDRLAGLVRPQVVADPTTLTDTGLDTDTDGLTDFVEERIDTNPDNADSDADGVNDDAEVLGFTLGGVKWFGDPNEADSNGDGVTDGQEWDVDTDGDLMPDAFDADNDNDLVPDRVDLGRDIAVGQASPFTKVSPFELQVNGLTNSGDADLPALPTMVEFQLRPNNPARMQASSLKMDWPADSDGQVQDVNRSTDDMRLVPMLEVIVPSASLLPSIASTDANGKGMRPELDKLNVGYNPIDNTKTSWYAYVPLTTVEDPDSGTQAAYTGRMLYNSNGDWSTAQQVRLMWNVQVKNDMPCDPTNAAQQAAGCTDSGYLYDTWQTVQVYYDEFYLTGLSITEEHGTSIAAIYEDPAIDPDTNGHGPSQLMFTVLNDEFLTGTPDTSTPPNYAFRLNGEDLASKLSHVVANNDTAALTVDDVYLVDTTNKQPSFDRALEQLTSTVLPAALDKFSSPQAAGTLQPWILTAADSDSRSVQLSGGSPNSVIGQSKVTLDFAPFGATSLPVVTMRSVKVNPWCADASGLQAVWKSCTPVQLIEQVDRELADAVAFDPDNPELPAPPTADVALLDGEKQFARLFALQTVQGLTLPVQIKSPGQVAELLNKCLPVKLNPSDEDETTCDPLAKTIVRGIGKGFKSIVPVVGWMYTLGKYNNTLGSAVGAARNFVSGNELLVKLGQPGKAGAFIKIDDATPTTKMLNALKKFGKSLLTKTPNASHAALLVGLVALTGAAFGAYAAHNDSAQTQSILIDSVIVAGMAYLLVEQVIMTVTYARQITTAAASGTSGLLTATTKQAFGIANKFAVIGAIIAGLAVVGFFIYQMVDQGVTAFSAEFNDALADVIAQLLYIALLTALSLTVVGAVIVAVVALIDAIITLVCDSIEKTDCFTISGSVTKALKFVLYDSDPMFDSAASDLVVPSNGGPSMLQPENGMSAAPGNGLSYSIDVTTNVTHQMWSGWHMAFYQYLYTKGSIDTSKFTHSLNGTPTAAASTWSTTKVNTRQSTDLYKGSKTDSLTTDTSHSVTFSGPGLNRSFDFTLSSAYSLPSYECWTVPNPFLIPPVIPVCYRRDIDGTSESPLPTVTVDVFPATLDAFVGLGWDSSLRQPLDADGDGLDGVARGGLDLNDAAVDADGDGLSDKRELNLQEQGVAASQGDADADADGLNDAQEVAAGTNPVLADTDNDGLSDGEEVSHLHNGRQAGGWPVTVAGLADPITVYSDPTLQDTDDDGISDRAEKVLSQQLATEKRLDKQNRPYHPGVANSSPLDVVMSAPGSAGFYKPGDAVDITTTVTTPIALQPSVVDLTSSVRAGRFPAPGLLAFDPTLDFDPITGAGSQTRQAVGPVVLPSGVPKVQFDAKVRAWLPNVAGITPTLVKETAQKPFVGSSRLRPATPDALGSYAVIAYGTPSNGFTRINLVDPNDPLVVLRNIDSRPFTPFQAETACNDLGDCVTLSLKNTGELYRRWMSSGGRVTGSDTQLVAEENTPLATFVNTFSIATDGLEFAAVVNVGLSSRFIRFNAGGGIISDVDSGPGWQHAKLVWARDRYVAFGTTPSTTVVNCFVGYREGCPADEKSSVLLAQEMPNGYVLGIAEFNPWTNSDPTAFFYDAQHDEVLAVGTPVDASGAVPGFGGATIDGVLLSDFSAQFGCTTTCASPTRHRLFSQAFVSSVTFDPASQQWLIAATTPTGSIAQFYGRDLSAGASSTGADEVACPAASALPVVSLSFNELPGATSFADVSGDGLDAQFAVGSGPDAGAPGAPNLQDVGLGVRFVDASDSLTLPNTAVLSADASISMAFWVRVDDASSPEPLRITWDATHELRLRPDTGAVEFEWGDTLVTNTVVNDGNWRLVVASAAKFGKTQLAVANAAGTPVVNSAVGSQRHLMVGVPVTVQGGGSAVSIDQLQIYNSVPTAATIQDLAANVRSSCMSIRNVNGTISEIVKLSFTQPASPATVPGGASLTLRVDGAAPVSSAVVPQGWLNSSASSYVLAGTASDGLDGSGVAKVEVSVDGGSTWVTATGTEAWAVTISIGASDVQVLTRSTDAMGNVETPGPAVVVKVDKVNPSVSLAAPGGAVRPLRDAVSNVLSVGLSGSVSDASSGVGGVEVMVMPALASAAVDSWQSATVVGGAWSIDYSLPAAPLNVSGSYTVRVRAVDLAGNRTGDVSTSAVVRLDSTGPAVALSVADLAKTSLAGSAALRGSVTDAAGSGVASVDVAFTPIELATPAATVWSTATLLSSTTWSIAVPSGIEGFFQIDLRATDNLGNETLTRRVWSGIIDTKAPVLSLTASPTGKTIGNGKRVQIDYSCSAEDLFLDLTKFACPGTSTKPATRTELAAGALKTALQKSFPGIAVISKVSVSYKSWESSTTRNVTLKGCDMFGNCASQVNAVGSLVRAVGLWIRSAQQPVRSQVSSRAVSLLAVVAAPTATIVSPFDGDHVAVTSTIDVLLSAQGTESIKQIEVLVDDVVAATRSFGLGAKFVYEEVVTIPVTAGTRLLEVVTTDWNDATGTSGLVEIFADVAAPVVTLATTSLDVSDTWAVGTDFYQFSGTVTDDGTVAEVQIRVNGGNWIDVAFNAGTWHTALHIPGADGKTLSVSVRAFDLAGRVTNITSTAVVDLLPVQPIAYVRPDATIVTAPAATVSSDRAEFTFSGTPGDNAIAGYRCQLDTNIAVLCNTPYVLEGLSGGVHTLKVAAIDDAGYVDLSPATHVWTVTPTGPQATLVSAPSGNVTARTARFEFAAAAGAVLECSLDAAIPTSCTSPYTTAELGDGVHTFTVQATLAAVSGTSVRATWTVVNLAPVAANQTVAVDADSADGRPVTLAAADVSALVYRVTDAPSHGYLVGNAPNVVYVPFNGYRGSDVFTFVADDGQSTSNTATVSVRVQVPDVVAPIIVNPGDQTVHTLATGNGTVVFARATATDNSGSATVVCNPESGSVLPQGANRITCTASDAEGNTSSTSFVVTHVFDAVGIPRPDTDIRLPVTGNGSLPLSEAMMLLLLGLALVAIAHRRQTKRRL